MRTRIRNVGYLIRLKWGKKGSLDDLDLPDIRVIILGLYHDFLVAAHEPFGAAGLQVVVVAVMPDF